MQQPIISIDLDNHYTSSIFQQALVKRYDCTESQVVRSIDLTPKIFMWISPSYHLVYKREASSQPFNTLHKKTGDTYEIKVYVPNIDASKYNTAIIVPKNNLIVGCYFPGIKARGIVKDAIFEAVNNQISSEKLKIAGNDLLLNGNKYCGIEEIYTKNFVVVASVVDIEYAPYKSVFEKYLTQNDIHKHRRTITGLKDVEPSFNTDKFIMDLSELFKEKIEKL